VQATLKPRRPGRRYQQHAGEGASVNACADQMLDINERLSLLAGGVTPADSNETTPNGPLQLQAARVQRAAADRSTDGRSNAAAAVDNPTMPNSLITGMAPASSFIAITSQHVN
jgi:hypothetical protein